MKQSQALEILKTGANVFLTGEPGSGKTYTVNQYIKYLRQHKIGVAVTASTGIAATHLNGMTIHSWSGIKIKNSLTKSDLNKLKNDKRLCSRARKTSVLIIDEISMLDAETLQAINQAVQALRDDERPFGGLQIVFVGDFFQLPPVNKDKSQIYFAYQSLAWESANPVICYLTEQHRQEDLQFLSILNNIRCNDISITVQETLQSRMITELPENLSTRLYSHNLDVDKVNEKKLQELPEEKYLFEMSGKGAKPLVEQLKKSCLSPEILKLKKGAKVMFTKNNYEKGFVNGTLGEITDIKDDAPIVKTTDGQIIEVPIMEWEINDGDKTLAVINQFPLRLAWAITVHKSQGMTLDAAIMDLSRTFEYGQGYVAISRVRNLSGLFLTGINQQALQVHPEIMEIDSYFRNQSDKAVNRLENYSEPEILDKHRSFILNSGGTIKSSKANKSKKVKVKNTTYDATLELFRQGYSIEEISEERDLAKDTIFKHLEVLKKRNKVDVKEIISEIPNSLKSDLPKIHRIFTKLGPEKLKPVYEYFKAKYSYDELHLARLVFEENTSTLS